MNVQTTGLVEEDRAAVTLPNFFVVGAPKAGTTSLYHYLDQHPDVYMSPIKEPNYFAAEIRPENFSPDLHQWVEAELRAVRLYLDSETLQKRFGGLILEWQDYVRLFQEAQGQAAVGEASACYLWSATAANRIAQKMPHAKIIMILRHPAERAYSQYLQNLASGLIEGSFRKQIQKSAHSEPKLFSPMNPLLGFGLYYHQVKRFLTVFPGEQVLVSFYEDYLSNPANFIAEIFRFLGVDSDFRLDLSQRYLEPQVPRLRGTTQLLQKMGVWQFARKLTPSSLHGSLRQVVFKKRSRLALSADDRAFLMDFYREDVNQLSSLLHRDLSHWLR